MKIKKRLPDLSESLHKELIDSKWIQLKEPRSLAVAILLSVPFMATNLLISIIIIRLFSSISFEEFGFTPDSFSITINLGVIAALIIFVIIHELLHLIFIPNFIKSTKTYVGLTLYGGFVVTEEEITKSRYILITIVPFLLASTALTFVLGIFGLLTSAVKLFVLLNAMASSVDMLNLLLVMKQVPNNTVLKNNGPKTYWKNLQIKKPSLIQ